jgi:beta-lactamase regulating signal transducer with metallopeptidase domain
MNGSAVGFVALCLAYTALAPDLTARMRPQVGVRLVVLASFAVAVAGMFVLGATGFTWAAQDPKVAHMGQWSPEQLKATDPVPRPEAGICLVLFVAAAIAVLRLAGRRIRALYQVRRAIRDFQAGHDDGTHCGDAGVVVVPDERADAFTTAGPGAVIVVTTGLLDCLTEAERQALLAHERSHRRHGHVWWLVAMDLAVAVNPLLARTGIAVAHAVERWADEDAAEQVADRRLVARTLARVALVRKQGMRAAAVAVMAAGGDVPARVRAMLGPRPRRGLLATVAVALLVVGVLVTVAVLQYRADAFLDGARG